MNNIAIITGITGQDSAYLAKLLLKKNYKVYGVVRSIESSDFTKLRYLNIYSNINFVEVDLMSFNEVHELLRKIRPNCLYNLASQSSVGWSNLEPYDTYLFNSISVLNMLESIRKIDIKIKFFQALSSEIFGIPDNLPINELESISPVNMYGASKASNYNLIKIYRDTYNIFAASGIFFNHESVLRTGDFFVKKVIKNSIQIKNKKLDKLVVGNLNVKRDFGYAPKYIEAMWQMLQSDKPDDYIICSGKSILLRDIVEYVFDKLELDKNLIIENTDFFRPNEIDEIYGDNSKAVQVLGWKYDYDFYDVLDILIDEELSNAK